ncbi:hypothetical protein [Asanoa siamensis]|uniref:Uncharacterized protein n=1 Tax=Asanoa siamensis TaxID=926357 RepID=A0ABQ4D2U2_9ACTN|nr:hypothetical protein [Asanoa siamensis]GIF77863.1 hypothetical protein Asi02nite_73810 [Asanoa siamensis]
MFRRDRRPRLPDDMPRWLERFGRHSFDVTRSGIDGGDMWDRIGSLHGWATSDRDGFLTALRAVVAGDQGGFATFGAARLVWEMYGCECLRIPGALPLIDAGIEFKRSRGLPTAMMTGYEMQRVHEIQKQDT